MVYKRLCMCDLTGADNNPVGLYVQYKNPLVVLPW